MSYLRSNTGYKLTALFLAMILAVPVLFACGKDKGNNLTPSLTATPVAMLTATPTTVPTTMSTSTPGEPVKIGAISSWSGPAAITGLSFVDPILKLVEKQVKDQGGILGGRDVKFVKYDNRFSVADAAAGAKKLILEDKVSVVLYGGIMQAEVESTASITESNHTLLVAYQFPTKLLEKWKYAVTAASSPEDMAITYAKCATKVLNAKRVAILANDTENNHYIMSVAKEELSAAGAKTVYEEYAPADTSDFSPYLTRIKYDNPDVLILSFGSIENSIAVAKQIMDLGGWGDIKVIAPPGADQAAKYPGSEGWYELALYIAGYEEIYPGAAKFFNDYQAMYGKDPSTNMVFFYNPAWTAIKAVELAGTEDPLKVAEVARSGELEWDTPIGHAHFTPDGQSGLHYSVGRIEKAGVVVAVTMPE